MMKQSKNHVVIIQKLLKRFESACQQYRVLYFSAPCGVGKTVVANALLEGQAVCACSAAEPALQSRLIAESADVVLIDDFQLIKDSEEQEAICALINQNPGKHFIFLSRSMLPGWLMPYQLTGLLTVINADELLFDRDCIRELAEATGAVLSEQEVTAVLVDTKGYPLLVSLIIRHLSNKKSYTTRLLEQAQIEMFHYVEDAVYRRFSPDMRRLLVSLCPFDGFDTELAKLVSGNSHVNDMLNQMLHETTMLEAYGVNTFRFWPVFRKFLLWELEQECTEDEQNDIYRRAGLYYELRDDYAHALDCYVKCGEHSKISKLLILNSDCQVGAAHYYDMEPYYYALPRENVLSSPELMCGMSMLTSLCMDYEASEQWYTELKNYTARLKTTDVNYKIAKSKLIYLDIALPQRGSKGLAEIINTVFRVMTDKQLSIPQFSVTSCMPSIMNGGKDFCEWSKKDDLIYTTMRLPVEAVLGKDGIGLADCAICESKFEKGEDVSARLLSLMARLGDFQRKGTPDILFAVVGLLARYQLAQGKAQTALDTLNDLRDTFVDTDQTRFLPNLDAMCCRIWLRMGDTDKATGWLRKAAPSSLPRFRALWRYRYMTKAMCLIANGKPDEAMLSIAPLLSYCRQCSRVMDELHIHLLMAICYYNRRDDTWKEELRMALNTAAEYNFIMPISQYGTAILPLLTEYKWSGDREYFNRVITATREQAVNYPMFLRPAVTLTEPLSPAETQVLKLLCHNLSNQEIADILGVKLTTVKSQIHSILQKLGVSRRSQAKEAAETLHLI